MFHLNYFAVMRKKTQNLFGVMGKSNEPKRQFTVSIWVPGSPPKHAGPTEELLSSGDDYTKRGDIKERSVVLNNHQIIKC